MNGFCFMKMLSDFLALILFFLVYGVAYKFGSFFNINPKDAVYYATAVAIAITIIQILHSKLKKRKLDAVQIMSYSVIIIFGTIGFVFHDPKFFYWKPSVISWLMATALIVSHLMNKNGLKLLLKKEIALPEKIWARLTYMWISFLTILGIVNIIVAYNFSEATWVSYKTFGAMGLTFFFAIFQAVYLSRYVKETNDKTNEQAENQL